ncbi:helix-turn-helix domain-containing protein [Peribacillus alkalitolerans]|uniref:helix-turn-helix domain-containing protein n=1 Tax=Peribacillus alkalitolerans TaxID=1550385 RepID=UPI0013D41329|nr:helix-turn-helix transcriptional regulator [Peribacillus alkalitolerans]
MLKKPCKEYGAFIQLERERKKLTREKFSVLIRTNLYMVDRLEKGEVYPTDSLIENLSKVLDIPFQVLKTIIWSEPTQRDR